MFHPPEHPRPLLEIPFGPGRYVPLDLRGQDPDSYAGHLVRVCSEAGAEVAYGGYLEPRRLYRDFGHFEGSGSPVRNIHLGVDFWAPAGTEVRCPYPGKVHSFANRSIPGDYGPVILLQHDLEGETLFSLYGHLSVESLDGLQAGRCFEAGERLGSLGRPAENGGYEPHLHFQLIRDLGNWQGDYPGVCAAEELANYRENCPDPLPFLGYI
jgi:murein DD-endopeptidase MepM/ murein hydrolase activator NlpD